MWQPLLSDINSFCCWCSSNASSSDISLIKTKTTFSSNSFPQSTKITSKDSFAIKNSKNFNFLILLKFCRLLLFLLLISFVSSFSTSSSNSLTTTTQPRPSCREHLLNGNSENKILPLLSPSGTIYWLECRFPPPGPQSGRLSYQTIINNALTGQWLNFDEIKKENKQIYIQQQITNSDFLSKLIINSDECLQLINIKWLEENNLNETESVVLETFGKETLKFTRNITANINEVNTFPINSGPVIKINSPFLTKTAINFGPLICRQMLIPRPECQFELRSDKDRIRLKLSDLRKKATKISSTATLSISFRTSKPNGRLLELLDGGNGPLGALDLVDAYLLFSNHIIHPSKLLADGLWHTIHLHLHSLSVRIDNLGTSLSLRESSDSGEPKWIDILVHGEVAAIRILDSNGNDRGEEKWICNDLTNNDFLEVRQSLPQQHIFSQPAACAPSTLEQNFCNCKGPNSALIQNGGFSRNSQIAKCSLLPNDENSSVHLSRYSDRLAFLLIPMQNNNFGLKTTISVLFKSEKESGLILFGVFSPPISPTIAQQKVLLNGGILNSIGRIQVHFIDNKVFATQCLLLADGSEKCFSCFIKLNKAFGSHDQWTRISLFHQLGNNFMSVDDLVCLLSPNSAVVDPSELYRITAKNFLFVGGTFYAKNILLNKFISEKFKRDFQDNTKEKAPSLEGCIAEILINGNNLNIPQLINEQKEKAANSIINKEDLNNIFSIKLGKCGNCPNECKGAPCSRHFDLPICQCSQIYSASDKESGGNCLINKTTEKLIYNNLIEIPSSSPTLNINSIKIPIQTPSLIANGRPRIAKLNKIWILFKLPENKFNKELFLKIGSLYLNIANYGNKVLLESKEYGVFEEFLIEQTIDSRLHLFSIERKLNNFGANNDGNLLLIRFDNQIKYLQLEELPIFILSPSSTETFEIEVFQNKNENENLNEIINNNNNGCIEDLLFIYSTQTSNEELSSSLNDYHEINYGSKIKSKQLINFCGIRDPNIWLGNTSSWGKLSKQPYDNYINGGVEIINVDGFSVISKSSLLSRISLIITILLIILMLIALSIYLFLLFKQHLSQNSQQQQFTNHNGKLTTKLIFEQEKQPLNEKLEKDGNDNLINKNELEAPPRPPKNTLIDSTNPNGQNINEKQSNGWNNDSSSPLMSVRPLESSPRKKQILSNGREGGATPPSPLRMTPLRPQQQLKNGNSQQNFAPTTTINSSSSSPPPLPPPSSFNSDRSLSRLAPTSNNSILSGGGLFTPSSPISELTSSSISPSGDSLRDSELMRPPNIKIISSINSKRHSPIDSIAAPIACKEEL